jgi:hypothetical protein
MLVNEQKSSTFSSIVDIRGKKHLKNAHNNKCHIYYLLNYDKKISEFLGVPVGVRQKILTESELGSESKKSTPQGTTLQQHDTGTHVPCVTYRDEQSGPGTGTKIFFSPGPGPEFFYRRDQNFFFTGIGT